MMQFSANNNAVKAVGRAAPVHDSQLVAVPHGLHHLLEHGSGHALTEAPGVDNGAEQLATGAQLHYHVNESRVLMGVLQREWVSGFGCGLRPPTHTSCHQAYFFFASVLPVCTACRSVQP